MGRIFVAGALHHDVIVRAPRLPVLDETLTGSAVGYALGGKGGNQAVAAARHGGDVAFAGRIGDDSAGVFLRESLSRNRVDVTQVAVDPDAASGMSVAVVTEGGEYGAVIVSAANLSIDGGTVSIPGGTSHVLLQNEIPQAANIAIAAKAESAGATVILNAAPARRADPVLLAHCGMIVVNRVEAAMLSDELDMFLTTGGTVIETRGSDGYVLRARSGETAFAAHPVKLVSAHGAGDCFCGALAARLAAGDRLEDALQYASAAAALHVSRPVADRGSVTPAHVHAMIAAGAG